MQSLKPDLSKIDAIIFDLGGVIINLDTDGCLSRFEKRIPSLRREEFNGKAAQHAIFSDFEMGKLSAGEVVSAINETFQADLSLSEFTDLWNSMILDFPRARIELLRTLRESGKRLFLLSNINEIHEKEAAKRYEELKGLPPFFDHFEKVYYSHHLGLRKPDPKIFTLILKEQGLDPARTLFIDDTLMHVESSRKLGVQGFHLLPGSTILEVLR